MTRADEIEREVEKTRGHLDQTVNQLGEKMSPARFIDELRVALFSGGENDPITMISRNFREHPMPMVMMGIGLAAFGAGMAWLALDARDKARHPHRASRHRTDYVGRPDGFGDIPPPPEAVTVPGESGLPPKPAPSYGEPRVTPAPAPTVTPIDAPNVRRTVS